MLSNATVEPTLPATDLDRAKAFYQDKLGFVLKENNEAAGALTFACGNGTSLVVYKRGDPPKAENTAAHFRVGDLEAEVQALKGKGVVFEEYDYPSLKTVNSIATMGGVKGAWFKDSEGNILGMTE